MRARPPRRIGRMPYVARQPGRGVLLGEFALVAQLACGVDALNQSPPALMTAVAFGDLFAARE
jgi:hypothetical protein